MIALDLKSASDCAYIPCERRTGCCSPLATTPCASEITKETCRLCRPCPRCRLEKASKLLPGTWQKNTTSILINPHRMTCLLETCKKSLNIKKHWSGSIEECSQGSMSKHQANAKSMLQARACIWSNEYQLMFCMLAVFFIKPRNPQSSYQSAS